MAETSPDVPWVFIAHKNGVIRGIVSGSMAKKDLRKFLGEFAADGYAIMTVKDRDEYHATLAKMRTVWDDEP